MGGTLRPREVLFPRGGTGGGRGGEENLHLAVAGSAGSGADKHGAGSCGLAVSGGVDRSAGSEGVLGLNRDDSRGDMCGNVGGLANVQNVVLGGSGKRSGQRW